MNIQKLVLVISNVPMLIAVVYVAIHYRNFMPSLKGVMGFIMLSLIVQLTGIYLFFKVINNMPLLHFFVPIGFILLLKFYHDVFSGYLSKRLFWWLGGIFTVCSLLNSIYLQDLWTFNSYALSLESLLIVILSLSLFVLLLNETVREEKRTILPTLLWINAGFFIYFASGLLLFYFGEFLTTFTPVKFRISWAFHAFIYVVLYVCILMGLWKHPKKSVL